MCCWKMFGSVGARKSGFTMNDVVALRLSLAKYICRRNALHACGPLPSAPPRLLVGGWHAAWVCKAAGFGSCGNEERVIHLSHSTATIRFQRGFGVRQTSLRHELFPVCTMDEMLYGLNWLVVGPLLTTDDAVRLRAVANRWNEGDRYGALGNAFFTLLKLDLYRELWQYDSNGYQVCTSSRQRIPLMEGTRKWTSTTPEGKAARWASRDGFGLLRERGASFDEGSGRWNTSATHVQFR